MFSQRTPDDLRPNRLARAVDAGRARGARFIDLTQSNPTRAGLTHPPDVLTSLATGAGVVYEPEPLGTIEARRAVAADLARRGVTVDPRRVILTASTSEAYSFVFKLLCDPGDEVLVPVPSYPLFDHLTRLDGVVPVPYALDFHGAWALDLHAIERALTPRTRAVCVVSPNNPTGSHLKRAELAALAALCRDRGVALLGDEVFFDYPLDAAGAPRASVLEQDVALSFSFGGLSKSAALPQLKLGWMAVGGPASLTARALERLELVADTYLSVSTPVQLAAAALFEAGNRLRPRIQARLAQNLATLRRLAGAYPACRVLPVEGGWSAVVQVPATRTEEELVLHLIEEDDVIVHPGYFFDFPCEAFVVVSLLVPPDEFDEGTRRMLARASA